MSYSIPSDVPHRIEAQLAGGEFSRPDQVLREAIEAFEHRQRGFAAMQSLTAAAIEDVAAGRVAPLDREAIQREVNARLAAQGIHE